MGQSVPPALSCFPARWDYGCGVFLLIQVVERICQGFSLLLPGCQRQCEDVGQEGSVQVRGMAHGAGDSEHVVVGRGHVEAQVDAGMLCAAVMLG